MTKRSFIRHVVFFSAKDPADLKRIVTGLSMLADIPHSSLFEVVQNTRVDSLSGEVDVVVYAEFTDQAALDAYKAHHLYEDAIAVVRPLRDLRIAADFLNVPVAARIEFDHGPAGLGAVFDNATDIIRADAPDDISRAFAAMEQARASGKWLAGFVSYEFGYLTSPKLVDLLPSGRSVPLLQFGVFDGPQDVQTDDAGSACLVAPVPVWDAARYQHAFDVVHDYIGSGDIYQVNLTFPLVSQMTGTPAALYAKLRARQPVPHGSFVDFGDTLLLSRSPELFFSLSADGQLRTRPMKGTAPRGATPDSDDALRDALQVSVKNRAENLMIVDLLRNDMSRVSQIGSVKVPELFFVERFETLHQMTSCITSQIIAGTSLYDLFMALFPCGSITGAPKVRAMQIIHQVEPQPRDAYCGSIGWIAPDGSMEFNVAIRTLHVAPDGGVRMNVGGGVVYDSTSADEYGEALLKAQFAHLL